MRLQAQPRAPQLRQRAHAARRRRLIAALISAATRRSGTPPRIEDVADRIRSIFADYGWKYDCQNISGQQFIPDTTGLPFCRQMTSRYDVSQKPQSPAAQSHRNTRHYVVAAERCRAAPQQQMYRRFRHSRRRNGR